MYRFLCKIVCATLLYCTVTRCNYMVNRNQHALITLPYNNGKILNWNTIGCRMTVGLMLTLSYVGQCRTTCLGLFSE